LSSPIEQLLIAKSRALLHDPPNKMWVLKEHESVAREFRGRVVGGTGLALGLGEDYRVIVDRADRMASTFDRWLINTLYTKGGTVIVEYDKLHNILKPDKFVNLHPVSVDETLNVASEIGDVLREIDKRILERIEKPTSYQDTSSRIHLLYSTLYFLLEIAWYSKGLSPSLADTRTPTHTVFDHLYAIASITNLNLYHEPKGFIVRVDIPGVQAFISASRRTSDFWAGSWILSQLMWGLIRRFIDIHGPDVVLSPTLRLNPYFFEYIMSKLEEAGVEDDVTSKLCGYYVELLSKLGWGDLIRGRLDVENVKESCSRGKRRELLEMLTLTPLIPATAYLVLPPFTLEHETLTVENIREEVLDAYIKSWHELVNSVANRANRLTMERSSETRYSIIERILNHEILRRLIELPHVGVRIDVVDVGDVYNRMLSCLRDKREEVCRGVGLSLEIVEKLLRSREEIGLELEDLARNILWHTIMTRVLAEEATKSPIPIPRPFWMLKDGELEPIGDYRSLTKAGDKDWSICSLCGEEPAIIHPVKIWDEEAKVEVFEKEWLKKFRQFLGVPEVRDDDLRPIFRPGEALGPYCLFKRIVGEVYSDRLKGYYGLASTDDVALVTLTEILRGERESELEELSKRLISELKCDPLPFIIGYVDKQRLVRDIERAARLCNLSHENFVSMMSNLFGERFCPDVKACLDIVKKMYPEFQDDVERFAGITVRPKDIRNFLKLRTRYSIIKGDGDFVGMIHQGMLEPIGMRVEDYTKILVSAVSERLDEGGRAWIAGAYEVATRISSILSGDANSILVSPTLTSVISMALQVTALRDVASIIYNRGFPVYSGGDDVLALAPIEGWFDVVKLLRSHFWGDYESLFHRIGVNGAYVVVAQALPTGRSFSVRMANILDIMSHEISRTLELLEGKAKGALWRGPYSMSKDSLVVSDSRSRVDVVLPLSITYSGGRQLIADRVLGTLGMMFIAENLGVISSNLPEDLDGMLRDPLSGERISIGDEYFLEEALLKIFERVLYRNVSVREPSEVNAIARGIIDRVGGDRILRMRNNSTGRRFLEELVDFIRASRGWL